MANSLSIAFQGLCFAVRRTGRDTQVLCHPEDGAHVPALVVPINAVDVGANQWQPDFVGHDGRGEEIGVWDLRGQSFDLGVGAADSAWQGVARGFRMRDFHTDPRPVSIERAREVLFGAPHKGALVGLASGVFAFAPSTFIRVRVRQRGVEGDPTDYASSVHWEGQLDDPPSGAIKLPANAQGQTLKLRLDRPVAMQVTNVAKIPAPQGLQHFDRYYDFLEDIPANDRISLVAATRDITVYDCVPPGATP